MQNNRLKKWNSIQIAIFKKYEIKDDLDVVLSLSEVLAKHKNACENDIENRCNKEADLYFANREKEESNEIK